MTNNKTSFLKRHLPVFILICTGLLLTGCSGSKEPMNLVPPGAIADQIINLEPCTYKVSKVEYQADCGTLIVPENRSDPESQLIGLPVTRIHSTGISPQEPIFWFAGGPGSSNMGFSRLTGLIDKHDIVMVGYRGVDGSSVLDCPELIKVAKGDGADLLGEDSINNIGGAFTQCFSRLSNEGFDLDGYTITGLVEDNEAARKALGYEKANLLSGSYGTRVAQIYAWMHPESVFRSVMISVNPPGHMVWEPDVLDKQIEYDAELCAADIGCSSRTSDLAETMRNVAENMPRRWFFLKIDPGKTRFMTHFFLWHRGQAASAYDIYISAENGDPSGLALMSLMYDMMIPKYMVWGELGVKGVSTDYDPERDYFHEMNPPDSILGAPMSEFIWSGVQAMDWPITQIPQEWRRVQSSDVETLLVSGNIDATTPAEWATDELLPFLNNGEQVILSEFGHTDDVWELQEEATVHLLTTFFDTGEVDSSLFIYQQMDFEVGLSFPTIAKIILAVLLILVLLIIVLVRLIIKKRAENKIK